jgi:predicted permease
MRAIWLWFRALVLRRNVEDEMQKEMRLHLEMETEENIRRGMTPGEARRRALVAFGGIQKAQEEVRDERGTRWLEAIADDTRYALRNFVRQPGYAIVVALLLALGIGGNTALFSILYRQLISPLPFKDGNRMVRLWATGGQGTILLPVDEDLANEWRRAARTVEDVTLVGWGTFVVGDSTRGGMQTLSGAVLPPGAAEFIGMRPELGRAIAAADTLPNAVPVVLLSHAIWTRDFNGDRAIIGKPVLVNGLRHVIVGVVPPGFKMPFIDGEDLFTARRALVPSADPMTRMLRGSASDVEALAKLRRGRTVEDANREVAAMFARLRSRSSAASKAASLGLASDVPRVVRAVDLVRPAVRQTIYVLFGAVSLVLLIACANVANLLLVRAWSRQREFAVRAAIGAGQARLIAQVLTESLLLSIAGGVVGLGVAALTLRAIMATPLANSIQGARLEPTVLLWCVGLSLTTGILFGIAPARFAAENRVTDALKAGARTASTGAASRRFRATLVGVEVALSVVLLCGAGLLVRTLVAMQRADVGMETRGLVSYELRMPDAKMSADARRGALDAIVARVRTLPGVRDVTLASAGVTRFVLGMGGLQVADRPVTPADSLVAIGINGVEPDYFQRVGLRVTRGRIFQPDTRTTDARSFTEIMVNERFARQFWPDKNAVGQRVKYGKLEWSTIVGVVRDVDVPGVSDRARRTQIYHPLSGAPTRVSIVVRSAMPVARMTPLMQTIVRELAPAGRLVDPIEADKEVAAGRVTQRYILLLLAAFAGVAVLLATVGLHAVIAYSVGQRTREIGVRVALGAEARDVMRLVLWHGLAMSAVGVAIGTAAAIGVTRVLRSFLYGVEPGDPATLAAVAAGLLAIAVLASCPPAWRAARLDPVRALRTE